MRLSFFFSFPFSFYFCSSIALTIDSFLWTRTEKGGVQPNMTRISVYTWRILLSEVKQELAACIAHSPGHDNAETQTTQKTQKTPKTPKTRMDPEYLVDALVRAYV